MRVSNGGRRDLKSNKAATPEGGNFAEQMKRMLQTLRKQSKMGDRMAADPKCHIRILLVMF